MTVKAPKLTLEDIKNGCVYVQEVTVKPQKGYEIKC
jgi:hypothetical protein